MRAGNHEEPGGCHDAIIIPPMLLAVDIGNTQTHIGAFDGAELAHDWRLHTDPRATADELAATMSDLLALDGIGFDAIDASIVSTVVPQLGPEYRRLCERHTEGSYLKVGPNLKTGMPILVDNSDIEHAGVRHLIIRKKHRRAKAVARKVGTGFRLDVPPKTLRDNASSRASS